MPGGFSAQRLADALVPYGANFVCGPLVGGIELSSTEC